MSKKPLLLIRQEMMVFWKREEVTKTEVIMSCWKCSLEWLKNLAFGISLKDKGLQSLDLINWLDGQVATQKGTVKSLLGTLRNTNTRYLF